MTENATGHIHERLSLRARLSEIARIPRWIESLASQHSIPIEVQFAIELCLEEAVSNVVRHGYGGDTDRLLSVGFAMPQQGVFEFVVEDEAPRFNPLDAPGAPELNAAEKMPIGGQGIRLMRQFTDDISYEATATGNRLTMRFSVAGAMK